MVTVDRLVILSTILFGTAALLVLISLSRPRWILSIRQGITTLRFFSILKIHRWQWERAAWSMILTSERWKASHTVDFVREIRWDNVSTKILILFRRIGETSVGLIEICITSALTSNQSKCFIPRNIRSVWIVSFGLAISAVGLLTLTVLLFLASQYAQVATIEYGRLTGFLASKYPLFIGKDWLILLLVIFLCLSTVLFPMGFDSEIIGGSPFQLPTDYHIGSSYIAFVGATWLTVISAIVAGKLCLPRFVT